MNWLWPQNLHSKPRMVQRFGRVVHWFLLLSGVVAAVFCLVIFAAEIGSGFSDTFGFLIGAPACVLAGNLLGRTLRYILADE